MATRTRWLRWICCIKSKHQLPGCEEEDAQMTFEHVLTQGKLQGVPTYKLPYHPRCAPALHVCVQLSGKLWGKIAGLHSCKARPC